MGAPGGVMLDSPLETRRDRSFRLAVVASHPVQYYAPWFARIAEQHDLEVLYCHRQDAGGQSEAGFGVQFDWDLDLLSGYQSRWLSNVAKEPGLQAFRGCDTPELDSIIRDGRFDAVLALGWNRKSYLQAAQACRRYGVPFLLRGDSQLGTSRRALLRAAKYLPYRALLPRAAAHLYVGTRNREYLEHYGVPADKLFFVPHCVDTKRFAAESRTARESGAAAALRREHEVPEDAFLVLYVGKLMEKKRVGDLVEAVPLIPRKAGRAVQGLVVGDGPELGQLRDRTQRLGAPIRFAGFQNQSRLPAFYAAADALVLPSDGRETWGLVVNEAMAAGLPAIVSDQVGCGPDLITSADHGAVFRTGDVSALAEATATVNQRVSNAPDDVRQALERKSNEYSLSAAARGLGQALAAVVQDSAIRDVVVA